LSQDGPRTCLSVNEVIRIGVCKLAPEKNFLAKLLVKFFNHLVTADLLDTEVFWELIDPTKIFLILPLLFKSIFLMSVLFKLAKGWSYLLERATSHAHCRGVIVLLRGSPE
jgi:hypothetical protein